MPEGQARQWTITGLIGILDFTTLRGRDVGDIRADAGAAVGLDAVGICPYIEAVAHLQTIPSVARKIVVAQHVAGTLENAHPVLRVPEGTVGMDDVVRAVPVDDDSRPGIIKGHIANDQSVIHLTRDGDPMPLLRAIDRVEGNDGFPCAVMRVQSIDNAIAELVPDDLNALSFVGMKAEMEIMKYAVDDHACRARLVA